MDYINGIVTTEKDQNFGKRTQGGYPILGNWDHLDVRQINIYGNQYYYYFDAPNLRWILITQVKGINYVKPPRNLDNLSANFKFLNNNAALQAKIVKEENKAVTTLFQSHIK